MSSAEPSLIDAIYETTLVPQSWESLLEQLADNLGGSSAWLSRLDVAQGTGSGLLARLDPAWSEAYNDHFYPLNPFLTLARPEPGAPAARPPVYVDDDQLDRSHLVRSEYFNEFMRPQGVDGVMVIRLFLTDRTSVAVNINRSEAKGGFTVDEQSRAAILQPHLSRAYAIQSRLAVAHASQAELSEAIQDLPNAMIIVTADRVVRRVNAAAEALLRNRSELRVISGLLTASDPSAARALEARIASAGSSVGQLRRGHSLSLLGAEGSGRLFVSVSPLRTERSEMFGIEPSVLVTIGDPGMRSAVSEARLVEVFGLTRAEARVAAAVQNGARLNEIAEALQLKPNTVRVQLARVFEKTGVTRQADLVRLSRSMPPI